MVRIWLCTAWAELKPLTMSAVTGTVCLVPSEYATSMVRLVTSSSSPTWYSVLWAALLTEIPVTVGAPGAGTVMEVWAPASWVPVSFTRT